MGDERKHTVRHGVIPIERITQAILIIRGQKVMLDEALAALYEVEVKVLNQRSDATPSASRPTSCFNWPPKRLRF